MTRYYNRTGQQRWDFETCELLKRDLIIEVDYSGRTVVGRIEDSLNAPNLERVRNFLLDYCDEPMEKIEDLDVTPDQFKRRSRRR